MQAEYRIGYGPNGGLIAALWIIGLTLSILSAYTAGGVSLQHPMATWGHVNTAVRQGENLTLSCTVYEADSFTLVRVVHAQGSVSRTVADNYNLKPPYSRITRYRLEYVVRNTGVATLTLSINDVQGEDTGVLFCYRLSGDDEEDLAVININVLVPVTDLYIIHISADGKEHRVKDGDDIMLEETLLLGVGCVATTNKTSTPAELEITIGGEDEMKLFELTNKETAMSLESGLSANSSVTRAGLVTAQPKPNFNGKTLKCVATRKAYEPVIVSAHLMIMYIPIIVCSRYVIVTSLGDHDVTFDCSVRANPSGLVKWRFEEDQHKELSKDKNFVFVTKAILADSSDVSMTIKKVSRESFGNYSLIVVNDVGTSMISFTLAERPEPPPPPEPILPAPLSQGASSIYQVNYRLNCLGGLCLLSLAIHQHKAMLFISVLLFCLMNTLGDI